MGGEETDEGVCECFNVDITFLTHHSHKLLFSLLKTFVNLFLKTGCKYIYTEIVMD